MTTFTVLFLYSIVKQCKAGLNPNMHSEEDVILTPKETVEQHNLEAKYLDRIECLDGEII